MDASILSVLLMLSSSAITPVPSETGMPADDYAQPQQVMLHDEIDLEELAPEAIFEAPLLRAA